MKVIKQLAIIFVSFIIFLYIINNFKIGKIIKEKQVGLTLDHEYTLTVENNTGFQNIKNFVEVKNVTKLPRLSYGFSRITKPKFNPRPQIIIPENPVKSQNTGQVTPKRKPWHQAQSSDKLNHCLKLAPKNYTHNEARIFTAEELDISQYKNQRPLIPKIIHQTWDTYDIPQPAVPYVKTIVEKHPDWQYWFWTADDIKCYMQTYHKEYMDLFNSYPATIFRTDVMRYFVLYDFGGFYLDLDVNCLKPLDIWTHIGSSILSHETYEHTFFGHMRKQPNVMTTILATKPRHPYYKLLQENLQLYHETCPTNVLYSTGPFYIDNIYQLYVQNSDIVQEADNITIIHPRYWLPSFTKSTEQKVKQLCDNRKPANRALTTQQRALCENARNRRFYNGPFNDSYLDHHWANSNVKGSKFLTKETHSMIDLVPNLRNVSDILELNCN